MSNGIRFAARAQTRRLVVLAHGVGASAADLEPLGHHLRNTIEGLAVFLPDGPEPFDRLPQGRQWFSISGVSEANRPGRVAEVLPAFRAGVLAEAASLRLAPVDVFVGGFSQGAIMALALGVDGPETWAGIVALSGRLAQKPPGQVTRQRALIRHGDADPVMAVSQARFAADWLGEAGWSIALQVVPGLGHTIDGSAPDEIASFITASAFPPSRG